jgi:hypothetical protein
MLIRLCLKLRAGRKWRSARVASITFNGSVLDATLRQVNHPVNQQTPVFRATRRGYFGTSSLIERRMSLSVVIVGSNQSDVIGKLDSDKAVLNLSSTAPLVIGTETDRYWNVRFESISGEFSGPMLWRGVYTFSMAEPMAYSVEEFSETYIL